MNQPDSHTPITALHHPPPFSLAPEPCIWFDDIYCHARLTEMPLAYLDALQGDLQMIADGELCVTLPPKQLFGDTPDECAGAGTGKGDFRVMPCVVRGAERITKTVKVVGSNFSRRLVEKRMTVGRALYLDPQENFVHSEFAAFALSSARTGACAAIAHRLLRGGRSATVYGAGPVAWYSAFYLASDARIDRLQMIDPDADKARNTFNSLKTIFPRLRGGHFSSLQQVDDSEVVILATDSRTPFFQPVMTKANLVISLGADSDGQSELHPDWAGHATLLTDLTDSARIGDLQRWQTLGLLPEAPTLDLVGLLRLQTRPRADQQRIVFISTGSALFDNLSIHYLLGKAGEAA